MRADESELSGSGGLAVKRLTKDGPVMQNGMVKVGDTLVSVGGPSQWPKC